jgi:hypothetical protein
VIFQEGGWFFLLVEAVVLVPLLMAVSYRNGGRAALRHIPVYAAIFVLTMALVPFPWFVLAIVPMTIAYNVIRFRQLMLEGLVADLVVYDGDVDVDAWPNTAITLVRSVGFEPLVQLRFTPPAMPVQMLALLDWDTTTAALVTWLPGAARWGTSFVSVFPNGRTLYTSQNILLPCRPSALAQGFPGASVDVLLAEHRAALAWLAEHGDHPVPLDRTSTAEAILADHRSDREHFGRMNWSVVIAAQWVSSRGGSLCRGSIRARPDAIGELRAWSAA